jgi:hypothetical protein
MLTDFIDCLFMYSRCEECFAFRPATELLTETVNYLKQLNGVFYCIYNSTLNFKKRITTKNTHQEDIALFFKTDSNLTTPSLNYTNNRKSRH